MDGWITIGTKLDTTKFDQEVSNLEGKIDSAEKKKELINQKTEKYKNELSQVSNEVDRLSQEYEKASAEAERLRQTVKTSGTQSYQGFQANLQYEEQVKQVDKLSSELAKVETKQQNIANKVSQSNLQYENSVKTVNSLRGKLQQLNVKQAESQFGNINKAIGNMQKGLSNSISKIGKLALGVFSVYSAYRLVSRASSTLAQYDEQYSANLQYIQYALTQVIAPVLRYLVDLAGTLLNYINYIANAWFGINLFSNASAKKFAEIASSAGSTANSAKEIKKQLAGFDEMTILGDSNVGTLGGGIGSVVPDMDFSQIDKDVPEWLKWIADNGEIVKKILIAIGSALAGLKLASIAEGLGLIGSKLSFIRGLGIGVLIYSIINLVSSLIEYFGKLDSSLENNGTSWFEFGNIIKYIGLAILGVGAIILSLPATITGVIVAIVGVIMKYWNEIKAFLQKGIDWFNEAQQNSAEWLNSNLEWIGTNFGIVGQLIMGVFVEVFNWGVEIVKGAVNIIIDLFEGLFKGIKGIFDGILLIFKGDFGGGLISIGKGIVNALIGILNGAISAINAIIYPIRALISAIGNAFGANWSVSVVSIPKIPYLKKGGIVNLPNQGVPVGRAMAGESGAEGVIPLTDSQQMALLGEAIGKYITINANITNTMNGRIISRQIKKIQSNQDFAYNT